MFNVAVIVGSLRKDSFNRKLALALDKLSHPQLTFSLVKVDDIPLYNQDDESNLPASVMRFKKDITDAHAVLLVTPEYNRSIPGMLKNLIDWGTRPWGQNSWSGKLVSAIGISPGVIGTAIAQSHLKSIMVSINTLYFGFPEMYLVYKDDLIDKDLNITNEGTRKYLQDYLDKFSTWIAEHTKK